MCGVWKLPWEAERQRYQNQKRSYLTKYDGTQKRSSRDVPNSSSEVNAEGVLAAMRNDNPVPQRRPQECVTELLLSQETAVLENLSWDNQIVRRVST